MININSFDKIMLQIEPVDFRKGRKSLAIFVQTVLEENPFSRTLFLFRNKRRDTLKALYWDRTGFAMWEKELEEQKFPWPKKREEKHVIISAKQLEWLLNGIDFEKIKPHKELKYSRIA